MPETYYQYTPAVLAKVCPVCSAAVGAKCLRKTQTGKQWREEPHAERVQLAEAHEETA